MTLSINLMERIKPHHSFKSQPPKPRCVLWAVDSKGTMSCRKRGKSVHMPIHPSICISVRPPPPKTGPGLSETTTGSSLSESGSGLSKAGSSLSKADSGHLKARSDHSEAGSGLSEAGSGVSEAGSGVSEAGSGLSATVEIWLDGQMDGQTYAKISPVFYQT